MHRDMELSANNNTNAFKVPNKFRDPYYFEDIIDLQGKLFTGKEEIDLSRVSFIEPYSMISLILFGRSYLRSRGKKLKLVHIPLNIHQYLTRMDFFKMGIFDVPGSLNEKYLLKRSSFSTRVIEITEIPNKERESVMVISNIITLFRKRASHILKYWLSNSVIDYFVTVISELCQNIFEHSLDSGYLSIQTYSLDGENIVRLVISDSGIGIKKSFQNNSNIQYDSEAKLIEMALTTPISSKRQFGYGLCQVNSIIKKLKGTIFIRSQNASVSALYYKMNKGSSYMFLKNDLSQFNGTQISISLSG